MKHLLLSSLLLTLFGNCAPKAEKNYNALYLFLGLTSVQSGTGNLLSSEGKATALASSISPFSGRSIYPLTLPNALSYSALATGLTGSTSTSTGTVTEGSTTTTNVGRVFSGTVTGSSYKLAALNVGTITSEGTCSITSTYLPSIPTTAYPTGATISGTSSVISGNWTQATAVTGSTTTTTNTVQATLTFNAVSGANFGTVGFDEVGFFTTIKNAQTNGTKYLGYVPSTTLKAKCAEVQSYYTLLENHYKPTTLLGSMTYVSSSNYSTATAAATDASVTTVNFSYTTTLNTTNTTGLTITQGTTTVSGVTLSNLVYKTTGEIITSTPTGSTTSTYFGKLTTTISGTINGGAVSNSYTVQF
ncbi:MAG: hypothetical protein SFU98_08600 [Leptospiraceae bacterium]|nr:hypothetical protein [Leptospiraceae bacterium]